jgi:asparagine synthase (glutamine-hydrolysing)
MCGIAGIVYQDRDRPVPEALVRRMCTALRHRGPDDEGLHVRGPVGLGMRRLSIIDLSGGQQPIYNEDRSKVIVFNGEIYNYRELRSGLLARGHTIHSHSDTETVLHLYEERGADCVTPLRGMFAFAIWDASNETLLLGRDRFGIKPLFVGTGPWGIAFASELKALHAAGLTGGELDWEALDSYFQLGYVPAPTTAFQDVRKLEPGHTLLWRRDGGAVTRRYWRFPLDDRSSPPPQVEARVRDWIDESVAAHLVSDVPVAAFLSGGLDSSAVVASMALAGDAPHAFTARYTGSGAEAADETELARALAARHGADLSVIDIRPDVSEIFEPIVYALDEPHADDSAIPTWMLSQAVGSRYKVALTGIGGDELFAGYRRHIGLLATEYYAKLPAPLRRLGGTLSRWIPEPGDGALGVDRLKRFLHTGNGSIPDRFLGLMSRLSNEERLALYTPELRAHVTGGAATARFRDVFAAQGNVSGLAAGLYMDSTTFLPDDILALSDRLSMAHSLEMRVPFVDHVLVEAVFPIPQRLKIGPLWEKKRLLRRALRPRLPAAHFKAPKRGFVGPTAAWLRNELRPMLIDELSPARQQRLGYFDPSAVDRVLQDHLSGRQNQERILLALLCFSTWHRLYVESSSQAGSARVSQSPRHLSAW